MATNPPPSPTPPPTPPTSRRSPWTRIVRITRPIFQSEIRWYASAWLVALLILLLGVGGLNVVNSFSGRYFTNAIIERDFRDYRRWTVLYLLGLGASTTVAVLARFCEERLGLLWRSWLTEHLVSKYLHNRAYQKLQERGDVDNPDQRMTEDVKNFTTTTLSFSLMLLNASIAAFAFSQVLWLISPLLLGVAVGYAALGSAVAMLIGRKLVGLNNLQLNKEANFRYELIHVREFADSIALVREEDKPRRRLSVTLLALVDNFRSIVAVNRNLGFWTTGYGYLIPIVPVLIVAPRCIRGEVDYGVVTQATIAFAQILGAFSLIVTQFQQISTFAAVVNRLGTIYEALEDASMPAGTAIEVIRDDHRIAYEGLTLRAAKGDKVLVADLNVEVPLGRRLLILGPANPAKSAIGRATAAAWDRGEGRVFRPEAENVLFVPERPYTAFGTLRDQFFEAKLLGPEADEKLIGVLTQLALGPILDRVGGLDVEGDWASLLTIGEAQLLGIARLLIAQPKFAVLDRSTDALSFARARHVYELLSYTSITYISLSDQTNLREFHDNVLEILDEGRWSYGPAREPAAA